MVPAWRPASPRPGPCDGAGMDRSPADLCPPADVPEVTGSGLPGYRLADLVAAQPAEAFARFDAWLRGQGVGARGDGG